MRFTREKVSSDGNAKVAQLGPHTNGIDVCYKGESAMLTATAPRANKEIDYRLCNVPPDLWLAVRMVAEHERRTLRQVVFDALTAYCNAHVPALRADRERPRQQP